MSDNEHSIGFYMLESYRLDKDVIQMHKQKKTAQTMKDKFAIMYQIVSATLEKQGMQVHISTSIEGKEINKAEKIAFLLHNCERKVRFLLDKFSIQKSK